MIRALLVVLSTIAVTIAGGPVAAELRKAPDGKRASALRLDPSQANAGDASKVYIVQMAAKPAVSYQGGLAGLAKTAAAPGKRYNAHTSEAQQYTQRLISQHDTLLASVGASSRKLYSYVHALNGFAARLTPHAGRRGCASPSRSCGSGRTRSSISTPTTRRGFSA